MPTTFHVTQDDVSPAVIAVAGAHGSTVGASVAVTGWPAAWAAFPMYLTVVRGTTVVTMVEATGYAAPNLALSGPVGTWPDAALRPGDVLQSRHSSETIGEIQRAVNAVERAAGGIGVDTSMASNGQHLVGTGTGSGLALVKQHWSLRAGGAVGDGTADDTAAIRAVLTAAGVAGGSVTAEAGTYVYSGTMAVPPIVTVRGMGRNATTFRAAPGFGGPAFTLASFSSRLESMTIDCNFAAGSVGVFSDSINEQSGLYNVCVVNFARSGFRVDGTGSSLFPQGYAAQYCEFYMDSGSAYSAPACIELTDTFPANFDNCTLNATVAGQVPANSAGARLIGNVAAINFTSLHAENLVLGIDGLTSNCQVDHFNIGPNVVTGIGVATGANNFSIRGATPSGSVQSTLVDPDRGYSSGNQSVTWYAISGGTAARQTRHNVTPDGTSQVPNLVVTEGGTFNGPLCLTNDPTGPNVLAINAVDFSGENQGGFISINSKFGFYPNWFKTSTAASNNAMFVRFAATNFEVRFGAAGNSRGSDPGTSAFMVTAAGASGKGTVPPGGTTGQVLAKVDGTDLNVAWATVSGGGGGMAIGGAISGATAADALFAGPGGVLARSGSPLNAIGFNASGSALTTTGSIVSGSATLTLASALDFANGQGILVVGAGAAGADLVTTIGSGSGTTTLTLAAAAGTTATTVLVQHDDTAAIQAALNAAVTAGGGTVVLPDGTYRVNGPVAPSHGNSILHIAATSPASVIRLVGVTGSYISSLTQSSTSGAILLADRRSGVGASGPSVLWAESLASAYVGDLTIRTPANPTLDGINFSGIQGGAWVENVTVDTGNGSDETTAPTHGTAALRMPNVNNKGQNYASQLLLVGHDTGLQFSENCVLNGLQIFSCKMAMRTSGGNLTCTGRVLTYRCTQILSATGAIAVDLIIDNQDIGVDLGGPGWWNHSDPHIADAGNFLSGKIEYFAGGSSSLTTTSTSLVLALYNLGTNNWITRLKSGGLLLYPAADGPGILRINTGGGNPSVQAGSLVGTATQGAIYLGNVTPGASNYALIGNGTTAVLNAPTQVDIRVNDGFTTEVSWNGTQMGVGVAYNATLTHTLEVAGTGSFAGKLSTVGTAAGAAGLALPHGTAPTSPVNGDVWTTTAGVFARVNGSTVGPFGAGGAGTVFVASGAGHSQGLVPDPGASAGTTRFLREDATFAVPPGGGSGSPGGSDTYVQFNDASAFGGVAGWTFDKTAVVGTLTGSAPGRRLANDSTHYSRETRSATGNTYARYNKVNRPSGSPSSLSFNGTSTRVAPGTGVIVPVGDFTVACWVKPAGFADYMEIFAQEATGLLQFRTEQTTGELVARTSSHTTSTGFTLSAATWYHVALTVSGSTVKVYANGSLLATDTQAQTYTATAGFVGAYTGGFFWHGLIDDFFAFSSALTGGEIATLAAGGAPTTTPVLHYDFNEGTGATATDTSPSANNGTISSPAWSVDIPSQNPSPPSSSLVEAVGLTFGDGITSGEKGVITLGDPAGRAVIQAGTSIDWVIGATKVGGIDVAGNIALGHAALATTATDGFVYLPTCAGTPTGVPTAKTGMVAVVYDVTNDKICVYNGGWKKTVALT